MYKGIEEDIAQNINVYINQETTRLDQLKNLIENERKKQEWERQNKLFEFVMKE